MKAVAPASTHAHAPSTHVRMLPDLIKEFGTLRSTAATNGLNQNVELEMRMQLTREQFVDLATSVIADANTTITITHTADVVAEKLRSERDFSKQTHTIEYRGAEKIQSYWRKESARQPIVVRGWLPYKIAIAVETPISAFPPGQNALLRLKNRLSVVIGEWRLDLTAVKSGPLKEFSSSLQRIRNDFFRTHAVAQWCDLPFEMIDSFECELEYIAPALPTVESFSAIAFVFNKINPAHADEVQYQAAIASVAALMYDGYDLKKFERGDSRFKSLCNQVLAVSKQSWHDVAVMTPMYVTDKADGQRVIVDAWQEGVVLGSDGMIKIGAMGLTERIIVDGERVGDVIHVFDVLMLGKNVTGAGFEERLLMIPAACAALSANTNTYKFVPKTFELVEGDIATREKIFRRAADRADEGLIVTIGGSTYLETKNYKWKRYEKTTIDFLAVQCPRTLMGTAPYIARDGKTLYLLFVGINHRYRERIGLGLITAYKQMFTIKEGQDYYPVQFSPAANPLAYLYYSADASLGGKIVELSLGRDGNWEFHRTRDDRKMEKGYFGNDYRVASLTYMNYIDEFTLDSLWRVDDGTYFTKLQSNGDPWFAGNKFRRSVITWLMTELFTGKRWMVDLASGRGADTHRYQEIGVENCLFVDVDKSAISELVSRWVQAKADTRKHVKKWLGGNDAYEVIEATDRATGEMVQRLFQKSNKNLTVHVHVADLTAPWETTLHNMAPYGVYANACEGVVCNFAIHYFCATEATLLNFLQLVAKLLRKGEVFMFTCMDGKRIFELLNDIAPGESWFTTENNVRKYELMRGYAGKKLAPTGQMIKVRVGFADALYEEPLCNIDHVAKIGKKCGLVLERYHSMLDYMPQFQQERSLYDKLTDDDKLYAGLHTYVTMRRV
jgi:mRNA capping enzyme